jgi:hypothetical protein
LQIPLGREPIFFRDGAIIPMRVTRAYTGHGSDKSAGSLTVLVFPGRSSTFRYREHAANRWITFASDVPATGDISIAVSERPREPLLYRIERQAVEPRSVGSTSLAITLNQGAPIARLATESEVEQATTNAWTYDASAKRVIVKFFAQATSDGGLDADVIDADIVDASVADSDAKGDFDATDGPLPDRSLDGPPLSDHHGGVEDAPPRDGEPQVESGVPRDSGPGGPDATPVPIGDSDGSDCDCNIGRRSTRFSGGPWLVVLGAAFVGLARSRGRRKGSAGYPHARIDSPKNRS